MTRRAPGQRRQHRAFRIPPPDWPGPVRAQLARLLAETDAEIEAEIRGEVRAGGSAEVDEKAMAVLATQLWRARRKVGRGAKWLRQAGRDLDSCREVLAGAGVTVQDHDGDRFHAGQSLEVMAFEEDPSLAAETVRETVQPSVYLADRRIQRGKVIVGMPPNAAPDHEQTRDDHA